METVYLSAIVPFIAAGLGAYFGAYLKKKGENLATHEDLEKIVEQVAAITKTTKEIEAKISNDVWDRQKQWEIKKEVVFEVLKAAGALHATIARLHSTYKATIDETSQHSQQARLGAFTEFSAVHDDFTRAAGLASIVVNANVDGYLDQLSMLAIQVSQEASTNNVDASWANITEFTRLRVRLQAAIRVDLGIGPPVAILSGQEATARSKTAG